MAQIIYRCVIHLGCQLNSNDEIKPSYNHWTCNPISNLVCELRFKLQKYKTLLEKTPLRGKP